MSSLWKEVGTWGRGRQSGKKVVACRIMMLWVRPQAGGNHAHAESLPLPKITASTGMHCLLSPSWQPGHAVLILPTRIKKLGFKKVVLRWGWRSYSWWWQSCDLEFVWPQSPHTQVPPPLQQVIFVCLSLPYGPSEGCSVMSLLYYGRFSDFLNGRI